MLCDGTSYLGMEGGIVKGFPKDNTEGLAGGAEFLEVETVAACM